MKSSTRRWSLGASTLSGSKAAGSSARPPPRPSTRGTSQATSQPKPAGSKLVMRPAPDLPARICAQLCSVPRPRGVRRPIPVTTTRRMALLKRRPPRLGFLRATRRPEFYIRISSLGAEALLDELDGVADGLDMLGRVIRDLDVELLLERHHQLDVVEAVGAQVVDEGGLLGDLLRIGVQVFDNDLADAL